MGRTAYKAAIDPNVLEDMVGAIRMPALLVHSDGTVTASSSDAMKLLGLTKRAAKTAHLNSMLSPRNPEWLSREIRKRGLSEGWTGEVVIVRPDRSEIWVQVRTCAVPEQFGRPNELLMLMEDITDRVDMTNALMKRAEDLYNRNWELELMGRVSKMMLSNDDLQSLLKVLLREAASVANADAGAVAIQNPGTNDFVFRAVYGECPESYVARVSIPLDAAAFTMRSVRERKTLSTADISKEPESLSSFITDMNLKAMLSVPLVVGDEAFGVLVLADTIHRRHFSDQEIAMVEMVARSAAMIIRNNLLHGDLEQMKTYCQRTFDAISDMVFLVDYQGKLLGANRAFASRLDTAPSELAERDCAELLSDIDPDLWKSAVVAHEPCLLGDMNLAGEMCEVESYPLPDRCGRPHAAVIYARIVTGERRLREEIRQASKMAAVGELLAGSANSFGNVLKSIEGTLGELGRADSDENEKTEEIRAQVSAGSEIVQRLLSFAHGLEEKTGRVSLRQVTDAAIALCSNHPASGGKTVNNLISHTMPAVEAQRGSLQEVVFSLLLCALEETVTGGTVTLSARTLAHRGAAELRIAVDHCITNAKASDTSRIGLSASVAAVHRMGGVITAGKTSGRGTISTVRLDIAGVRHPHQTRKAA